MSQNWKFVVRTLIGREAKEFYFPMSEYAVRD